MTARSDAGTAGSPQERLVFLVRRLLDEPDGIDVYETAESLFVSRLHHRVRPHPDARAARRDRARRSSAGEAPCSCWGRRSPGASCSAGCSATRCARAWSTSPASRRPSARRGSPTSSPALVAMLDARGFFVNEYGINDVLLHMAVALDRVAKDRVLPSVEEPETSETIRSLAHDLGELIEAALRHRAGCDRAAVPGHPDADPRHRSRSRAGHGRGVRQPGRPRGGPRDRGPGLGRVPRRPARRELHRAADPPRAEPGRACPREHVLAQPAHPLHQELVPDDLRAGRVHREPAAGRRGDRGQRRRDRLHRHARRRVPGAAVPPPGRGHLRGRLPQLLRHAHPAARPAREHARRRARHHQRHHLDRRRLGGDRGRPGAHHDRPARAAREHGHRAAVPDRDGCGARPSGRHAHPPAAAQGPHQERAAGVLRREPVPAQLLRARPDHHDPRARATG